MSRSAFACIAALLIAVSGPARSAAVDQAWIARSNAITQLVIDIDLKHEPEEGSRQGLAKYDALVADPSLADELAGRREYEAALARITGLQSHESDRNVQEDLEILRHSLDLGLRSEDFRLKREVPFANASADIFQGLKALLDDQVAPERRRSALTRLAKYAGTIAGHRPYTEVLKQRVAAQMAIPGVIYPARVQIETELGRNANYLRGIPDLFKKYGISGWEEPYAKLRAELLDYDAWVRANVLPKARTDFRLPPEEYALAFEDYGIEISPTEIAQLAHPAFAQYQGEMAALAARIAKEKGYPSSDYRAVIRELKKQQVTGDAIVPLYEGRLHEIERIIVANNLVTLPQRPAIIRLATAAETAQEPAPHMEGPPLLHNTGQRGVFVLPLNIPSANGGQEDRYDDFTFDAAAWTLTAHEARPGHELQFDGMVEHGVSLARAMYAFNSTNVEGWALYAEYIMQPYEPEEAQLITLQERLLRAARAFLDPELQAGTITSEQAFAVLENDVVSSHADAKQEVERYTYRAPGQANSYFYGLTKLLELRKETETSLGMRFNQKKYHDFILAQGLLPPKLLRQAVLEVFVPSQR